MPKKIIIPFKKTPETNVTRQCQKNYSYIIAFLITFPAECTIVEYTLDI